jgi:hypothetical protein
VGGKGGLRARHGHGLPVGDDRVRGADPARREAAPPRRHVWWAAGRPRTR